MNIELYDQGTISTLSNDCLSQANYVYGPGVGACKLDEDHVILIGGKDNLLFFIHDIPIGSCERKTGEPFFFRHLPHEWIVHMVGCSRLLWMLAAFSLHPIL